MSKFIKSSLWNLTSNSFVRILSIVVFPFLVRYYSKSDISYFKSIQSLIIILITIIPFGTNFYFVSSPDNYKKTRWNNLLINSSIMTVLLIGLVFINEFTFVDIDFLRIGNISFIALTILLISSLIKSLLITKLSVSLDFKQISISLVVKQIFLYLTVIIIGFLKPEFQYLLMAIIASEILETFLLGYFTIKLKLHVFFHKNNKLFDFSSLAIRYIGFIGIDQIFNTLAINFPIIYSVSVMGAELAPEFQLSLYTINLPVILVMSSISKVIFPKISQLRDKIKIGELLLTFEYLLIILLLPILIVLSFLSEEIVSLFFNSQWKHAMFAVRYLPILAIVNIFNNPFTTLCALYNKTHILLIYSFTLFIGRLVTLSIGFKNFGFEGAIITFIVIDCLIRLLRLYYDLRLINLNYFDFFKNIKSIVFSISIALILYFMSRQIFDIKIFNVSTLLLAYILSIYLLDKKRIQSYLNLIILMVKSK